MKEAISWLMAQNVKRAKLRPQRNTVKSPKAGLDLSPDTFFVHCK